VRLVVRDSGGEGKPVVLIHGLGLGQRSWGRVAPRLSSEGLRVVSYDQRGHGGSDAADDYSPVAFEEDLAAVLEGLQLEKEMLVGHSLGAMTALVYEASHKSCTGVVCVEGGLPLELPSADWESMEAEMQRPLLRLAVWAMKVTRLGTKLSFDELRRVVEEHDEVRKSELEGVYRCITCPVLMVMVAQADPTPQGEEICAAVCAGVRDLQHTHPRVKVEWLPCGHNIPLERPAELAELIAGFAR
jgi:pimeloyl-ACP methyl ester carboxylesterase